MDDSAEEAAIGGTEPKTKDENQKGVKISSDFWHGSFEPPSFVRNQVYCFSNVLSVPAWFYRIDWEKHFDCKSSVFPKRASWLSCILGNDEYSHWNILLTICSVLFASHKEIREIGLK